MRLPIQYALSYPDRFPNETLPSFDWTDFPNLTFAQPDFTKFPCLRLAIEAGKKGGTYPAVLCAADEVAVDLFIRRKIKFIQIAEIIEKTMGLHKSVPKPSLDDIVSSDKWASETALRIARKDI